MITVTKMNGKKKEFMIKKRKEKGNQDNCIFQTADESNVLSGISNLHHNGGRLNDYMKLLGSQPVWTVFRDMWRDFISGQTSNPS